MESWDQSGFGSVRRSVVHRLSSRSWDLILTADSQTTDLSNIRLHELDLKEEERKRRKEGSISRSLDESAQEDLGSYPAFHPPQGKAPSGTTREPPKLVRKTHNLPNSRRPLSLSHTTRILPLQSLLKYSRRKRSLNPSTSSTREPEMIDLRI